MPAARAGSKRHNIARLGFDEYELSWQVEVKYAGSRILHHRTMRRFTNRAGAEKFAKKWNVEIPGGAARMISSPVEVDRMNESIQAVFKGAAFYNNGTITLAYQKPMRLARIIVNGKPVKADVLVALGGERIELEFEAV